jgi:hypothetical protein
MAWRLGCICNGNHFTITLGLVYLSDLMMAYWVWFLSSSSLILPYLSSALYFISSISFPSFSMADLAMGIPAILVLSLSSLMTPKLVG